MGSKITEQLYVTDIDATEPEGAQYFREKLGVDWMINLSGRFTGEADIYYPLKDGKMKDQHRFEGAVRNVVRELTSGKVVCVNCAAGVSRSVAVAVTALADYKGVDWFEAFQMVKTVRSQSNPHPGLRTHGKKLFRKTRRGGGGLNF